MSSLHRQFSGRAYAGRQFLPSLFRGGVSILTPTGDPLDATFRSRSRFHSRATARRGQTAAHGRFHWEERDTTPASDATVSVDPFTVAFAAGGPLHVAAAGARLETTAQGRLHATATDTTAASEPPDSTAVLEQALGGAPLHTAARSAALETKAQGRLHAEEQDSTPVS